MSHSLCLHATMITDVHFTRELVQLQKWDCYRMTRYQQTKCGAKSRCVWNTLILNKQKLKKHTNCACNRFGYRCICRPTSLSCTLILLLQTRGNKNVGHCLHMCDRRMGLKCCAIPHEVGAQVSLECVMSCDSLVLPGLRCAHGAGVFSFAVQFSLKY